MENICAETMPSGGNINKPDGALVFNGCGLLQGEKT